MLIAGGEDADQIHLSSVEMFNIKKSKTCSLPNLTVERNAASSSGLTVCGGSGNDLSSSITCETLGYSDGVFKWSETYTLQHKREFHNMWTAPSGKIFVIGGSRSQSMDNTEILSNPISKPGFSLKSEVSSSCSIDLGQSVVITGGGLSPYIRVLQYQEDGFSTELTKLNYGRRSHGCSSYVNAEQNIVRYLHFINIIG